jgi:hypothetical protein
MGLNQETSPTDLSTDLSGNHHVDRTRARGPDAQRLSAMAR